MTGQVVGTYGCIHKVVGSTLHGGIWPSIMLHLYYDKSPWCLNPGKIPGCMGGCCVVLVICFDP
jgi:hypothetical protein